MRGSKKGWQKDGHKYRTHPTHHSSLAVDIIKLPNRYTGPVSLITFHFYLAVDVNNTLSHRNIVLLHSLVYFLTMGVKNKLSNRNKGLLSLVFFPSLEVTKTLSNRNTALVAFQTHSIKPGHSSMTLYKFTCLCWLRDNKYGSKFSPIITLVAHKERKTV